MLLSWLIGLPVIGVVTVTSIDVYRSHSKIRSSFIIFTNLVRFCQSSLIITYQKLCKTIKYYYFSINYRLLNKSIKIISSIFLFWLFIYCISLHIDISYVTLEQILAKIKINEMDYKINSLSKSVKILIFIYIVFNWICSNIFTNPEFGCLIILSIIFIYALLQDFVQKHFKKKGTNVVKYFLLLINNINIALFMLCLAVMLILPRYIIRKEIMFFFGNSKLDNFFCYILVILLSMVFVFFILNIIKKLLSYLFNIFWQDWKINKITIKDLYPLNKEVTDSITLPNCSYLLMVAYISTYYTVIYWAVILFFIFFFFIVWICKNSWVLGSPPKTQGQLIAQVPGSIPLIAIGAVLGNAHGHFQGSELVSGNNFDYNMKKTNTEGIYKVVPEKTAETIHPESKILNLVKCYENQVKDLSDALKKNYNYKFQSYSIIKDKLWILGYIPELKTYIFTFYKDKILSNMPCASYYTDKEKMDEVVKDLNSKYKCDIYKKKSNSILTLTPMEKKEVNRHPGLYYFQILRVNPHYTNPMMNHVNSKSVIENEMAHYKEEVKVGMPTTNEKIKEKLNDYFNSNADIEEFSDRQLNPAVYEYFKSNIQKLGDSNIVQHSNFQTRDWDGRAWNQIKVNKGGKFNSSYTELPAREDNTYTLSTLHKLAPGRKYYKFYITSVIDNHFDYLIEEQPTNIDKELRDMRLRLGTKSIVQDSPRNSVIYAINASGGWMEFISYDPSKKEWGSIVFGEKLHNLELKEYYKQLPSGYNYIAPMYYFNIINSDLQMKKFLEDIYAREDQNNYSSLFLDETHKEEEMRARAYSIIEHMASYKKN